MQVLLWIIVAILVPGVKGGEHAEEQVLKTLEAMQTAVLAGDSGAYMAQVNTDDAYFATEQRAWFDDLSRNPVSDFRIEPLGRLSMGLNSMTASLEIRVHWTLESDGIERSLTYLASFNPVSLDLDGPWRYAGKHWYGVRLHGEGGLRVFADQSHKELATDILTVVPHIQDSIERSIGRKLSDPLTIKVYPTVQELQYFVAPGYINMLSGWNEPRESIKILGREDVSAQRISALLAHEIGHAVSFEYGPEIINAPWWSLEGIAELVADPYRSSSVDSRHLSIAKQIEQGDRRSWEELSDFKGDALNHASYVYSQGWSMVRHITQRYGSKARNQWFTAMGNGATVQEATKRVLKVPLDDLNREWEMEMLNAIELEQQAP